MEMSVFIIDCNVMRGKNSLSLLLKGFRVEQAFTVRFLLLTLVNWVSGTNNLTYFKTLFRQFL